MTTEARPIADWVQVLDEIEGSVSRRLAKMEEQAGPNDDPRPTAKAPLQILDERLKQIQTRLERAERDSAEVDRTLHTETEAYQRWTESMTAARRRLADWAARVP